jgi:diguanylate cyclase
MDHYLATSPQAKDIFNKIQSAFARNNITPTPINYLVWYEYYLNENKPLIEEVNKALANGGKWHDILGFRLYHGLIKQQCTDMQDFEEDLLTAHSSLHVALQGLGENLNNHAQLIAKGATAEQVAVLQQNNTRIGQVHQNTKTLLDTISQKAEKTINFNFRDPITKLYNQRKLIQDIDKLKPLGNLPPLLIIDMDHFAAIQQNHGALVAENIIRFIARTITKLAGKSHCYRTGDNEFVIASIDSEHALQNIAEQARKAIANAQLKRKDTGVSIGNFSITGVIFYIGDREVPEMLETARYSLHMLKNRDQRNKIHDL